MTLLNDICRCHDSGCPERETCARWTERDSGGERTPHAQSLFPYDIPIVDPCPWKIEEKE